MAEISIEKKEQDKDTVWTIKRAGEITDTFRLRPVDRGYAFFHMFRPGAAFKRVWTFHSKVAADAGTILMIQDYLERLEA